MTAASLPTVATSATLIVVFENWKADKDLGGNSRAHWRVVRRKATANKNAAYLLTFSALADAGTDAGGLLTANGRYNSLSALPLRVLCRRFYSGRSNQWDLDNLAPYFKGILDGVSAALQVNDKDFCPVIEQYRVATGHWLGIEVTPAWALAAGKERAG